MNVSTPVCQCNCCMKWRSGEMNKQAMTPEQRTAVESAWKQTLEFFKINRPVLPFEHMKLSQLVHQYGVTATLYALVGMRFEEKTATFDPAKNVGLSRVQDSRLFEKFVNLASREKTLQQKASGV